MVISMMVHNRFPATLSSGATRISAVHVNQEIGTDHLPMINSKNLSNQGRRFSKSMSKLLHLTIDTHSRRKIENSNWDLVNEVAEKCNTPAKSPKEVIAEKWREIHGSMEWEDLLNPLHPWLRREIVKYGEFAQATYEGYDSDSFSEYCGSWRYNRNKIFEKLGLGENGYDVTGYLYAMSHIEMPRWIEKSHLLDTWSKDSNWMGFVAVSDDQETRRIGRRDIAVVWRGTMSPAEWFEDFQQKLEPIGTADAKVEHGFHCIYKSKSDSTRYNKTSAADQVMEEIRKQVEIYRQKGEEVSLTITGHSLGGALALLNAYDAATAFPDLPISVISFGGPRVGNAAFRDELNDLGVKTLRIVVKQDLVPRMPGIVFNEALQVFDEMTGPLDWVYTHVGVELKLDVHSSPYLKHGFNPLGFHCPETYLHLIDGFSSSNSSFRSDSRRDVALVNKCCNMLVDELGIPPCWYQLANKGLVCNEHGRWVKPLRDPEDIPSPIREENYASN